MSPVQAFRGGTYNGVFLDEANYLNPNVYLEVLPNTLIDNGKLILMSSHKAAIVNDGTAKQKEHVDLESLRGGLVLLNAVCYVCSAHLNAILAQPEANISACFCFQQLKPNHIKIHKTYRRFMGLLSVTNPDGNDGQEGSNMLAEIGIDARKKIDYHKKTATSHNLAKVASLDLMLRQLFPINDYTLRGHRPSYLAHPNGQLDTTIVVYVDPSMHELEVSFNAQCYAARVVDKTTGELIQFVILALEEFKNSDVDSLRQLNDNANAVVLLSTIADLQEIYNGYFTHVVVAPERNSVNMASFFRRCSEILTEDYLDKRLAMPVIQFVCAKKKVAPSMARVNYETVYKRARMDVQTLTDPDYKTIGEQQLLWTGARSIAPTLAPTLIEENLLIIGYWMAGD